MGKAMKVQLKCDTCGRAFERKPSDVGTGRHFCSRECRKHRVQVPCANCGKTLEIKRYKLAESARHFCDRRCAGQWWSRNRVGENHPNWVGRVDVVCTGCGKTFQCSPAEADKRAFCSNECKSRRVDVPCGNCGKMLSRPLSQAHGRQHQFCDTRCMSQWHSKNLTGPNHPNWREELEMTCDHCGKTFRQSGIDRLTRNKHHFCSIKCSAAYKVAAGTFAGQNNPQWKEPIRKPCDNCGKMLERIPARVGKTERTHHFCSKACKSAWQSTITGPDHPHWRGGSLRYYGPNWNSQKRKARKRDGYKCRYCGVAQKKSYRALDVHHIKPFREFGYVPGENENYKAANDLANLITLCRPCHRRAEAGNIPVQPWLL